VSRLRSPENLTLSHRLVLGGDLLGTGLFAFEGAGLAAGSGLDLFGIAVIAVVTALGGGMVRDVLIGAVPAMALCDLRYGGVALLGAAAALAWHAGLGTLPDALLLAPDAIGLGVFAMTGTEKALAYNIRPTAAPILGTLTAVGGGVLRDILLNTVPSVLRVDIYATAALAGSILLVLLRRAGVPNTVAALLGGAACVALRVLSAHEGWHLPEAP
jgi:uncharacterized membrane protein YeiH